MSHPDRLAGRITCVRLPALLWPLPVAIRTSPMKTWVSVTPSFATSTPNSVPRSVTVAVGVRIVNSG